MKTLALSNGDLIVGPQGHETVSGAAKISTELGLALGEPYGDDRFHPSWGSTLQNFVGTPITASTSALIQAEVNRVLNAYVQVQIQEVLNDAQVPGTRSRFSTADVVSAITSVTANATFDTVYVAITLRTMAGQSLSINKAVNL